VSAIPVKELRKTLVGAGFEVFRVKDDEVHLAERQNLHLMEAGVRVRAAEPFRVTVTARAQRSDAPSLSPDALFELVRAGVRPLLDDGFEELAIQTRELYSVSDQNHVVDVWYELTLARSFDEIDSVIAFVRRALQVERYVVPTQPTPAARS
jgi:hypothetical protein